MTRQKQASEENAPASKKATPKKASAKKTPKKRVFQAPNDPQAQAITKEERHYLIAEAAYFIAEQRGFQGDAAMDDWLQAEAAIDARLLEDA